MTKQNLQTEQAISSNGMLCSSFVFEVKGAAVNLLSL